MILVEVEARSCLGGFVGVLSEGVDVAEAETLLTTDDTIERSTVHVLATTITFVSQPTGPCHTYSSLARRLAVALQMSFRPGLHNANISGCVTVGQNAMPVMRNDCALYPSLAPYLHLDLHQLGTMLLGVNI